MGLGDHVPDLKVDMSVGWRVVVPNRMFARVFAVFSLFLLAACGSDFETSYSAPIDPGVSRDWRVADVRVIVPDDLRVSEQRSVFPSADIVWREDPPGDRRAQVGKIVADAARQGTAGLRGRRPVVIYVTVSKFHALTFEAEARLTVTGVHNIDFTAQVSDARTGEILAGPEFIRAELPGKVGPEAREARARGETQKSLISGHLRRVFAGWLGIGPDPRFKFSRLGG